MQFCIARYLPSGNYHTYRPQKLFADFAEVHTTIEVPLQGCHDQLGGDAAGLLPTQVMNHVDEVTQTEEVLEPEGD